MTIKRDQEFSGLGRDDRIYRFIGRHFDGFSAECYEPEYDEQGNMIGDPVWEYILLSNFEAARIVGCYAWEIEIV